jgi:thymidine kinase
MKPGTLTVYCGPMFSGKTTALLLAEVERLTAERDTAMDRMQQAIIDLLNEHNAPLHLIARVVEMEYP